VHILEQYVRSLEENPAEISNLFADDGYFYDGGMKMMGWPKCCFTGKTEIHAAFVKLKCTTGKICLNGAAVRYNVYYNGMVFEAIGVATINAQDKIQTFVAECLPLANANTAAESPS
jgi:hypothetical protein